MLEISAFSSNARNVNAQVLQPQSGNRMQPTAQAVGEEG
jgi:hypothetical protein